MASKQQRTKRAGWGPRVGAALLDGLIIWGLVLVALFLAAMLMLMSSGDGLGGGLSLLLTLSTACAYYIGSMTRSGEHNGQTLGKQAAGIKVIRDDGQPITIGTVAAREILLKGALGYGTFGIGFLIDSIWPLGDRTNRALHDYPVKTHVVEVAPPPPPRPPLPWPAPRQQLQMAPRLARHVHAARAIEFRVAQLGYPEIQVEVSALAASLQSSAERAQLLYEALSETPVANIERRLAELEGSGKVELVHALQEQLSVQRRMQAQLERYDDELERVVVELDTVRGSLLTVSASNDVGNQELLADRVRTLRDEVAAVAEGVGEAYG
jgi:uncharacterized RDD family membrane protein YckC